VGKSLFRYAPEALPHEILNNCIAIHWPTFAPPRWPTFTPALTTGVLVSQMYADFLWKSPKCTHFFVSMDSL
jgi:hypothetical protein